MSGGDLWSLEDPLRDIYGIPLPRLSIVRRKCLAPYRQLRVSDIPSEEDDDCLTSVGVAPQKVTNSMVKGPSHWRIEHIATAVGPVNVPKSGLSVEQSHGEAMKWPAVDVLIVFVDIAQPTENLLIVDKRLELRRPFRAAIEPATELRVSESPFPQQVIEVLGG